MEVIKIIIVVLECLASIALIAAIMMQSGKESGLGALAGNSETYLSKSKSGSLDQILASATKWIALVWIVLAFVLNFF